jgi:hypothetical protein
MRGLVLALLAGALAAGGRYGWQYAKNSSWFLCINITVRGNSVTPDQAILAQVPLVPGRTIFNYRADQVAAALAGFPYIKSCTLKRRWFSTVVVCVEERSPVAYLALDALYLVDNDRMVLPLPGDGVVFDLPVLTGLTVAARPGQKVVSPGLDSALACLRALLAVDPGLVERTSGLDLADPRNLTLLLHSPEYRVFLGPVARRDDLVKLGIWEQHGRSAAGVVEYVDLRFAGQIIVKRKINQKET